MSLYFCSIQILKIEESSAARDLNFLKVEIIQRLLC